MWIFDGTKPLWMPEGSVRGLLAMGVIGAFSYMCVIYSNTEALAVLATMIVKDYFTARN